MPIEIKAAHEIDVMREVSRLAAETLQRLGEMIRPGLTTDDINTFVHDHTLRQGCTPAMLGYKGYLKSACTSVNDVVANGIPGDQKLETGDLLKVVVMHLYKGFHSSTGATFFVGPPNEDAKRVTEVARRCLELAIAQIRPGNRLGDIGAAVQEFAEGQGCGVVRDFVGHGIGRKAHDEPKVSNVGAAGKGERLKPGMTFCVHPMVTLGEWEVEILEDDWSAATTDNSLSADFKHTVLVTETGAEVLTRRAAPLANSELFPNYWAK